MAKHSGNGHKTETPDVSHIRNVEVTHEASDISVNGVLTFVVALTILTVAVYVGMLLLFNTFQSQSQAEPKPGPMALRQGQRLPPEPRLQAAPGFSVTLADGRKVDLAAKEPQAEYRTVLEEWDKNLKGELKDPSGAPVSIPISEAIKKVASEGLPARTKEAPAKLADYAISMPTAASSGRVTEKRLQ
jgi:hypothetical protein